MDLLVDCHWRFDRDTALRLIEDLSDANLYWIECPIPESLNAIPAMQELRQACNRHDMLLAGLESLNGLDAFTPYLEREAVDIVMPDVKYAWRGGGMPTNSKSGREVGCALRAPQPNRAGLPCRKPAPGHDNRCLPDPRASVQGNANLRLLDRGRVPTGRRWFRRTSKWARAGH